MAEVLQFDAREKQAESPLTPELKDFIDRVIVPILVKQYLVEQAAEMCLRRNLQTWQSLPASTQHRDRKP